MKKLILASIMALAATAAVIAPTQAASLTIQSDDNSQYSPDDQSDDGQVIVRRHRDRYNDDNQYGDDQYGVQFGDYQGGEYRRHHRRDYDDQNGGVQLQFGDYDGGEYRRHHRHHRCHIELVKHWRHHHRVIEEVRVCG